HALRHARRRPGNEVDHTRGEPRFLEQPEDEVVREDRRGRGLPYDRVTHDRGCGRQVAADRREIERGDGVDEPLERTVIEVVPGAGGGEGLLRVDTLGKVHIEA